MFNKNDYFSKEIMEKQRLDLIQKAESLTNPKDYFQGLPSSGVVIPENILMFYRRKSLEKGGPALHHRFVLICNLGGSGSAVIDSKIYRIKVGDAVLIYPHQFHIYADIESENISWLFITFEVENQGVLANKENLVFKLSDYAMITLSMLLDTYRGATNDAPKTNLNERILLALILAEMISNLNLPTIGKESSKEDAMSNSMQLIQKLVEFIYQNLSEPIQINDVAKFVHFSPSHLRSLFKKNMRIGLGAYIRRAKIHRACFLIRSTDLSFSQITEKCGFSSLFSFSRAFRLELKKSPTEYKNLYVKKSR